MLRFSAFLVPAALLLLPPATPAQTPPPASKDSVTFSMVNGELLTAVVQMERQYHIQCVLRDGVDARSKINLNMLGVPLSQALRSLASSAGAQIIRSPDGVYIFTSRYPMLLGDQGYSIPSPHFLGGFGSFGFGGLQPYTPLAFPHTPPVTLYDILNGRDPGHTQPGGVRRIFVLGQSF